MVLGLTLIVATAVCGLLLRWLLAVATERDAERYRADAMRDLAALRLRQQGDLADKLASQRSQTRYWREDAHRVRAAVRAAGFAIELDAMLVEAGSNEPSPLFPAVPEIPRETGEMTPAGEHATALMLLSDVLLVLDSKFFRAELIDGPVFGRVRTFVRG